MNQSTYQIYYKINNFTYGVLRVSINIDQL